MVRSSLSRLIDVTHWCLDQLGSQNFTIGYFGASTGGGAAIMAAAHELDTVKAIVSRGGRPDLAGDSLTHVQTPTLFIVGGDDLAVIQMNKDAISQMHCTVELEIIPGATHLFEEPGTLDAAAELAKAWFVNYLTKA